MAEYTESDIKPVDEPAREGGRKLLISCYALGDLVADISYSEFPENPRDTDGSVTTFVLNGGRSYKWPTEVDASVWEEADGFEDLKMILVSRFTPLAIRPVYAYDHGGVVLRLGNAEGGNPFQVDREWDTSPVGYIMVLPDRYRSVFGAGEVNHELLDILIQSELEEFSAYVSGEVYGYTIYERGQTNVEVLDSCDGFTRMEGVVEEAKAALLELANRRQITPEL